MYFYIFYSVFHGQVQYMNCKNYIFLINMVMYVQKRADGDMLNFLLVDTLAASQLNRLQMVSSSLLTFLFQEIRDFWLLSFQQKVQLWFCVSALKLDFQLHYTCGWLPLLLISSRYLLSILKFHWGNLSTEFGHAGYHSSHISTTTLLLGCC